MDSKIFGTVREYAAELKNLHQQRNAYFNEYERMYLMLWDEEELVRSKMSNVKITKSPDLRNAIVGAIRLLIATDPKFSLPSERNTDIAEGVSEKVEKTATWLWHAAGQVRQNPVHYDLVTSAVLFGEMHASITRTEDLLKWEANTSPAQRRRLEELAQTTPYLFDIWDPRTGYPDIGPYGLNAYYREVETTGGRILDEFGDKAAGKIEGKDRYKKFTLCHFWDHQFRIVWLQNSGEALVFEEHGLPWIPVVVQLGEGSTLFTKPEHQRQPLLYTARQSELWKRENLALTVAYTMTFAIGSNPMFIYKRANQGKELQVDFSTPGGVVTVDANEDFAPLGKNVIDPSILQGFDIAERKLQESTIFAQTLGQPLGSSDNYSMVSLLHQAGRLPLMVSQRKAGQAIAQLMKMALEWYRDEPGAYEMNLLASSDVPAMFEIEADLDVNLPQDKLQQATLAAQLTQGENPLVSQEWARREILGIEQSAAMTEQVWYEKYANVMATKRFAELMAEAQQMLMAMENGGGMPGQMQPGQPEMPAPGQLPPQAGQPEQPMPPEQPLPNPMQMQEGQMP